MKEKTLGRRRSTSRRKSSADPEPDPDPALKPSQDRLSPEPEPDPDPPCSEPTAPESNPEAASSTEEDRTRPVSATPLCPSSPGEESVPLAPSLDLSQAHNPASSPRPAPDPVQEDRPSLSHSLSPMEVDYSPSTVPQETELGSASRTEKSPALSPCSSPPVSPCPQLEDEDSLSPLFQRCLSEDSGGSPTPSLGHTKKR